MELAENQGGNNASPCTETHTRINSKLDAVVISLKSKVKEFGEASKNIKTLAEAVADIRKDIDKLRKDRQWTLQVLR